MNFHNWLLTTNKQFMGLINCVEIIKCIKIAQKPEGVKYKYITVCFLHYTWSDIIFIIYNILISRDTCEKLSMDIVISRATTEINKNLTRNS